MTPPESLPQLLCEVLQTTVELQQFIVQVHLQCMTQPYRLQIKDAVHRNVPYGIQDLYRTITALTRALSLHPLPDTLKTALYPSGHSGVVAINDIIQSLQPQAECIKGKIIVGCNKHNESSGIVLPQLLGQLQSAHFAGKVNIQKIDSRNGILLLHLQQFLRVFQGPYR